MPYTLILLELSYLEPSSSGFKLPLSSIFALQIRQYEAQRIVFVRFMYLRRKSDAQPKRSGHVSGFGSCAAGADSKLHVA